MTIRLLVAASAAAIAVCTIAGPALAGPAEDRMIAQLLDEGLNRSAAMETASELMDQIGPRLTNSEGHRKAEEWAIAKFAMYGLKNIHREPFEFGLGWNVKSYSATMTVPRELPLTVLPVGWSPATAGKITAPVIVAPMTKVENFDAWKGKVAGKIVLVSLPGESSESKGPVFERMTASEIGDLDKYTVPRHDPEATAMQTARRGFLRKLSIFLKAEGALAIVRMTYRDGKLVHGEGYDFIPGETLALPAMDMAQEDYRRLVRLEKSGVAPQITLSIDAAFDSTDLMADNIIADITGSDPKAGYVMAGAHFDSWIAGDGASDNGAGTVVVMEAARLISKLGIKPKRTIRFALWSGEEQGLLGSKAYIEQHLATRPVDPKLKGVDSYSAWRNAYPITPKPGYADMKAYFNMDNGSGKFRGIYAEGNIGAVPLLRDWLSPFNALGADKVVMSKTGGTDHVYIQAIGLPGYQFIQDPLDYDTRVHHSSLDTLDHMRADDIRQASVVLAGILLQAAMSEKELPRGPMPTKPDATDPFKVQDPNQ